MMRIIGGIYRGRQLERVGKETTRETADMVRQAVFNMIFINPQTVVLDLFTGSGAYALEAISRGAKHAIVVDHDIDAVKTVRKNANAFGEPEKVVVIKSDYRAFLADLVGDPYDVIFLDPPYDLPCYVAVMEALDHVVNLGGFVVCESAKKEVLPEIVKSFEKTKEKTYGIKKITIYRKIRGPVKK